MIFSELQPCQDGSFCDEIEMICVRIACCRMGRYSIFDGYQHEMKVVGKSGMCGGRCDRFRI